MSWWRTAGGLLLSAGVVYLGYGIDRTDFQSLLTAFGVAFLGYGLLVFRLPDTKSLRYWIGLGLLLRLVLVFAFPLLSDDVYRFIWDGRLVAAGYNPFTQLPAYYVQGGPSVAGLDAALFDRLNSPEYYTIYPPVAQGVFALAAWLSPGSWYGAAVVMKVFLLLCELGTGYLLYRLLQTFALPSVRLLYYWLNPLILVEITGNLHFEGAMICFLLLALYALTRGKYGGAAGAMGLSIASKLLPLMFLPFLLGRLWRRSFWVFYGGLAVVLAGLFLPLFSSEFISGFGGSLDLYFRKFEFNASLYYLLRAYGYYDVGWNQIARYGPVLAALAGAVICILALSDRTTDWRSLPGHWLAAFTLYLLCATTVHPWYLAVPIVLCVFTPWRFPLVWSFFILLTYISYTTVPYQENLWLVAMEYGVVSGYYLYERSAHRTKMHHP